MTMETAAEILPFVKELVAECAAIALGRAAFAKPREKANLSYVTDLDHEIEHHIRDRLGRRFPGDRLTGEELAEAGGGGHRRWSIDPIDGTGNLVHGLPLWAISVGLVEQGQPVLGVIAIPPLGELYWAVAGGGAFRDGEPITAAPDHEGFHRQDNVCVGTNALRTLDTRTIPGRLRNLGSACCEQVFTASGRHVASTFLGEQYHDMAAGSVIASEAGCQIGTLSGRILTPAELLARTPIKETTFIAPPGRLQWLLTHVRRLA
jgi:myo-inositol-1(or 4)-monophosphatase